MENSKNCPAEVLKLSMLHCLLILSADLNYEYLQVQHIKLILKRYTFFLENMQYHRGLPRFRGYDFQKQEK